MVYNQADKERKLQLQELESYSWKLMETPGSTKRIELRDEDNNRNFKVNGHQKKPYIEGLTPIMGEVESISLMEPIILEATLKRNFHIPLCAYALRTMHHLKGSNVEIKNEEVMHNLG
ncbi:hypothetical protein CR513_47796, partial [Mucuna pruriens]